MTQDETKQVLSVLRAAYPNFYKTMPVDDQKNLLLVWSDLFECDDVKQVMLAVKTFIRSNPSQFPPSVGQITDLIYRQTHPTTMTEQDAWNLVYKACCNSIYHSQEEFDKLPVEIQSVVGNHTQLREWAKMDNSELNTVVSSNFMRSFRVRSAEIKEYEKLPETTKKTISEITNAKRIENT